MRRRRQRRTPSDPKSFRSPMAVTELNLFWNRSSYYVCPRCRLSLTREYMAYCDNCGQCLDWSVHRHARVHRIFPQ